MDWQAATTVATFIGVLATIVLTMKSLKQNRDLAKQDRDQQLQLHKATAELVKKGVQWRLEHYDGDRYQLVNDGDEVARDVEVSAGPELGLMSLQGGPDLARGETVTFIVSESPATPPEDRIITVEYSSDDDTERHTWKRYLPESGD